MSSIYLGNFFKGLQTDKKAYNIDNEAFPFLFNFYSWRGQIKKKRGTATLGQLERQLESVAAPNQYQVGTIVTLDGNGDGAENLITKFSLAAASAITAGDISFSDGTNTFTEPSTEDGTLVGAPAGTGTINYATSAITITGGAANQPLVGTFSYFPHRPVMGLREFFANPSVGSAPSDTPRTLSFDTKYAYQLDQAGTPDPFYSVSYYKSSQNPVAWTAPDHQQFWTTNFSSAFWATNNKPGFHFLYISTIAVGNPTTITTTVSHGLITNDYVFFNEVTGADADEFLNKQAFIITKTGATTFTVAVDTIAKTINNDGIVQTLTVSPASGDGIRFYDGDMTNGTGIPTASTTGWVNFSPPLTASVVGINTFSAALYYLVGARMIVPYKDRLLFFGPWIQTSGVGASPINLADTVIWSWSGTPYYADLVPVNEAFDATAYYIDQTGKGGFLSSETAQTIISVQNNEDVLIVGFSGSQTRFVFTGDDINPFLFFSINTDLTVSSTFSGISLDRGVLTLGAFGMALTTQSSSQRIDIPIPNQVFELDSLNNGVDRVNAIRDYFNEWAYFTYPYIQSSWKYPTRTFLYNYREANWAILSENYTTHGTFRQSTGYTWGTLPYKTWGSWNVPWNSGSGIALFPSIIAGNPQGYVLTLIEGTSEAPSGTIKTIADDGNGNVKITSSLHCLEIGDFVFIEKIIGSGNIANLNDQIGKVTAIDVSANTFNLDLAFPTGTYLGLGAYTRLCQPSFQTKQFPIYWDKGHQVRLGTQKYLMERTANSQVTLSIFLSMDGSTAYNAGPLVPDQDSMNDGLIYSQILYTSPESTNLGLTAPNTNLQMLTAATQSQIWHRVNTSLIGDTVQFGISLSEDQMKNHEYATAEIIFHAAQLDLYPGPKLA